MRRSDREVSDMQGILEIIDKCQVARLGLSDNGAPYIVPLNFGYEYNGGKLVFYFHSAREGRKVDILKSNPKVCFELDSLLQVKKDDDPCKWTSLYESVIGYGEISFVEDADGKKAAMDALMRHCGFSGTPRYDSAVFARTQIFRLDVETVTGKRHI
ncbi:pyridoxamine 5'-phosphate oxidase [Clostridia bacterium]|nr:pyridoxamine 5'-phosphate oxidase [Clostridia bacterium]